MITATEETFDLSTLTMRHDGVLVRLAAPLERTSGGLWIPETANQNKSGIEGALHGSLRQGVIEAAGPEAEGVAVGDRVSFYYFAEHDSLKWPTSEHMLVPVTYIQAVLQPDGTLQPLEDRILVERIEEKSDRFTGNFMLPDAYKKTPLQCRVVTCGPGKRLNGGWLRPVDVQSGMVVMIGPHSGTDIIHNYQKFTVVREEEILLVIEDDDG